MGELKKWRDQKWVRIGTDGKIKGKCGTSKDKKNPDRCLPLAKARSLSKKDRAATAKKKSRLAEKEKPLSATPKKPRSKDIVSVETLKSTEQKGRTKAKTKKAKRSRKAAER